MTIPLLSRPQLEIINRKTLKYPLHIAEKDYFLTLAMQLLSHSPHHQTLVFKGGTALHHCYLPQSRFSEDLDFSTNQVRISLDEVKAIFAGIDVFTIKKTYQSAATLKIETLQYIGPLQYANSLKIEIDCQQNVLLKPPSLSYQNVWGLDFKVRVMDIREITAEKIRATSDRARYRDFYDLFLILENQALNLEEIVHMISQKEIRQPISKANILKNWQVVNSAKVKEKNLIYFTHELAPAQIEAMIHNLPFSSITAGSVTA